MVTNMNDTNQNKSDEGHLYKGLFFGVLIGAGLIWFLNSENGKELVRTARKKIDEALSFEPGMEGYEYEDTSAEGLDEQSKESAATTPHRFFQKKAK